MNPIYQQQERKIHEAYIKGEIEPFDPRFCFCGTLAPVNEDVYGWKSEIYSKCDFEEMEIALLKTIDRETLNRNSPYTEMDIIKGRAVSKFSHPNYENALFNGMVKALEVLKQIHIAKGEVIDEPAVFKKRELQPASK